jgi:catechol 2,3-dioxygenase-like lactoylglutathione lyase family enzyme
MIQNLEDLGSNLADRVQQARLKIEGPASTDLGYGGAPVLTFWAGERRIHFSFGAYEGAVAVLIEVVDRGAESGARVGRVNTEDEAWRVVEGFLGRGKSLHRLPDLGWVGEEPVNDELIPHPPVPPPKKASVATAAAAAPEPAKAVGSAAIGGIVMFSNDAAKLARWYSEHLGIEFALEGGNYHAESGDVSFGIYPSGDILPPAIRAMLTFRVPEFDAFVEGLAGRGVNVEGLDRTQRGSFAYVRDTDGNPVELWDGGS